MRQILSVCLIMAALGVAGCSEPTPGPQGPPGAPGPAATFRVVTGAGSVSCGDDELLVSLVCATRATDGVKCMAPDAAATGLCVRKWSFATSRTDRRPSEWCVLCGARPQSIHGELLKLGLKSHNRALPSTGSSGSDLATEAIAKDRLVDQLE